MTIFTSLKKGQGRVAEIQHAALANWRECFEGAEIVDVGDGRDFSQVEGGRLEVEGGRGVCAWINADILFRREEVARVKDWMDSQCSTHSTLLHGQNFLIVGRRTDLLPGGQREVHRPSGMDYFFFRAGTFRDLPPTIMGRSYCDSALLAYCLRRGILVIDASEVLTATHQWHDYAHVAGGKNEVWQGAEALANKRNNGLGDFGPHIADVKWKFKRWNGGEVEKRRGVKFEPCRSVESVGGGKVEWWNGGILRVVRKRVPMLRRLGLWGMWNRLTHGGIGFWGIHEYVGTRGARFLTRSKVEAWSPNSNVQMRFKQVVDAEKGIWTGFDFPCMWRGWRERNFTRRHGGTEAWTIFLWDPPALGHRDVFPPLRWAIDCVFRWFARRCDRLVLNIHPGLLDEIGFSRVELENWERCGKLEFRMQDAFENMPLPPASPLNLNLHAQPQPQYDFGILAHWTKAKGGSMMAEALKHIPDSTCLWIGTPPHSTSSTLLHGFDFTGPLSQSDAFARLRNCRVLVVPYLNVPSLRWNYCLKLFEYLPLGRPILASDNPGNAAVAAKFPGRITLFKAGDWVDFIAKCAEIDHDRFYPAFRTLQEFTYKFHL